MDIDIDLSPKFSPNSLFKIVNASMVENNKLTKHPVGVYFQNIPSDPIKMEKDITLSAIPYKHAEEHGFFKIDFLHLNVLNEFSSKSEIRKMLREPPNWSLLENEDNVKKLFQISNHYDVISQLNPKSIIELADVLALIRPGKYKLINKYKQNKYMVRKELYVKREKYDMRKSHVIPYALIIVLQLHLIEQGRL